MDGKFSSLSAVLDSSQNDVNIVAAIDQRFDLNWVWLGYCVGIFISHLVLAVLHYLNTSRDENSLVAVI